MLNASGNSSTTINGTSRSSLTLAIGSKFAVGNDGTLYANGANVTNINAGNISAGSISVDRIKANVISSINQSTETVKIAASKVEIDGTAVFNNSAFQKQLTSSYSKTIEYVYDNAGQGTGYAKLANITATTAYLNLPITFTLYRRGQAAASHVTVAFANGSPTDTLSQAYYDGWLSLYYVRIGTGSYDIYIALGESWDTVKVADFVNPYTSSNMEVTWAGAYYGTSLPSGAVGFTRLIGQESKASYDSAIASAEANAKAYADTTKIGGRNLIPWSALSGTYVSAYDKASNGYAIVIPTSTSLVTKNSGNIFDRISSGLLSIGSQATLSFTAVAAGSTNLRCDFFPDTYTGAFSNVVSPVTTTPKRYTITGKIENSSSPTSLQVRFWRLASDANYAITIWDIKLESGTHATDWTPAPEDIEANAVKRTQRIYYRAKNPMTAWTMPTAWLTTVSDVRAQWTCKVPRLTVNADGTGDKYLYLYTCEQREMGDGTLAYTSVLLDDSTTVIDGGNIITGSVTANKLNAANINASKTLTVGAMTDAAASSILNSNVVVGGRNLLLSEPARFEQTSYDTYVIPSSTSAKELGAGTTLTIQFWDVVLDANSSGIGGYWGGGSSGQLFLVKPDADGYCSVTFTIPAATASHAQGANKFLALYNLYNGHSGMSLSIGRWKLEKGSKATDWTPAPEDMATAESLAGTNESLEGAIEDIGELSDQLAGTVTEQNKTITTIQTYLNSLRKDLDAEIQSRQQWLNFNSAEGLVIGAAGSTFKTVTTNTSQQFRSGGTVLAETSGTEFVAPVMRSDQLLIGNWMWTRRDNGNLSLKWIG